jgi:hypothetical protein
VGGGRSRRGWWWHAGGAARVLPYVVTGRGGGTGKQGCRGYVAGAGPVLALARDQSQLNGALNYYLYIFI